MRGLVFCGVLSLLLTVALGAQEVGEDPDPTPVTLHVYANLIQVPVLVLSDSLKPLPSLEPERFLLSLNSGRSFHPTHLRREGDDPINLSILLDLHAVDRDLLARLPEALAALVPASLTARDHVTLYSLDCNLVRYAESASPNALVLKTAAETVAHGPKPQPASRCTAPTHLLDAMAYIARKASSLPGRAVLLALTDGKDRGSATLWPQLKVLAASQSLAIFALTAPSYFQRIDSHEDYLTALCELTGGMVLHSWPDKLPGALNRFVGMLRDRYILYFPRPDTLQPGPPVDLSISLVKKHAFIRPAGAQVPIADAKLLADPNTIRSDPSHAPEIGTRRVIYPPR